jgi:hypothetical protein
VRLLAVNNRRGISGLGCFVFVSAAYFIFTMLYYHLETFFHNIKHYHLLTFLIWTWAEPKVEFIFTFLK